MVVAVHKNDPRRPARIGAAALAITGCIALAAIVMLIRHWPGRNPALADLTEVQIRSTQDGQMQPARLLAPATATGQPAPLLIWLHTWNGDYRQDAGVPEAVQQCRERGWIFLQPNFRGRNNNPRACGSDSALHDLLDAVAVAERNYSVDPARIYLLGESGGGYMALLAAARFPDRWSAVSAWVPTTDLAVWYEDSRQLENGYWKDLEACCGGPPSPRTLPEYRKRSPVFHLSAAAGLPIHIYAGIHDGHTGSVPIRHTLLAFNVLADANGQPERKLTDQQIELMTAREQVPAILSPASQPAAPDMVVLLHREAGPAHVTLFEGTHEMRIQSAFEWLSKQTRRKLATTQAAPSE